MPITITMPRLSDTMEQGTVVTWHVAEGDSVSAGDVIADIETDKATMELESFDDGVVAKLGVEAGKTVSVGETIVVLAEEGEDPADAAASAGSASGSSSASSGAAGDGPDTTNTQSPPSGTALRDPPASGGAPSNGTATDNGRVFASPLARKIAQENDIDLGSIRGSGPSGRIVKKDVEDALGSGADTGRAPAPSEMPEPMPEPPGAGLEARRVPLNNMRATIARRLVESKTDIPHYQVTVSARLDALMALRAELNGQLEPQGVKLSVNDFLVRACAIAMHEHPFVNASWNTDGPSIDLHAEVHVGVAVALPEERGGGLVVATINHADRIGLRRISSETKRLAKKAREKGLSPEELSGSTFTISNLGMFGVDHFTAIINPPNAAILAVGRAVPKPFVEENENGEPELVIGHEMAMTMSSDHRIIDGAMAAAYLGTVRNLLESPAALLV